MGAQSTPATAEEAGALVLELPIELQPEFESLQECHQIQFNTSSLAQLIDDANIRTKPPLKFARQANQALNDDLGFTKSPATP